MEFLEEIWNWFEDIDGLLKILVIALMVALGGAGFLGISVVKDIFSTNAQQQQEEVLTNKVDELRSTGEDVLTTGHEVFEDTKQKALNYTEELINKFKQ